MHAACSTWAPTKADWDDLYSRPCMTWENCWTTCDSFCCRNGYGQYFRLLEKGAVILALFPGEWNYLQQTGMVDTLAETHRSVSVPLGDDKPWNLDLLTCRIGGPCKPANRRPLLCQIYPFFPRLDAQGRITGYFNAALLDAIVQASCRPQPCTLAREHASRIQQRLPEHLAPVIEFPTLQFAFRAAEIACDEAVATLREKHNDALTGSMKSLVTRWESLFLAGRLWNVPRVRARLGELLREFQSRFGADFHPNAADSRADAGSCDRGW